MVRCGAYGIVFDQGKVLLVLQNLGIFKGVWALPGGGIEFGETPEEALKREFREEVAFEIGPFDVFGTLSWANEEIHYLGIVFHVRSFKQREDLIAEHEMTWVSLEEIEGLTLGPFVQQILPLLRERFQTRVP